MKNALRIFPLGAVALCIVAAGPIAAKEGSELSAASGPSPFADCSVQLIPAFPPFPAEINYLNAEVEPWLAIDPRDSSHLIGVWQQDRFSFGGARGLMTGVSRDGGRTWQRTFAHFSRCAGGTPANGGDYERASDPWVTFSPNGVAYQIAYAVDFFDFPQAVLVSRSADGGATWSEPTTLIRDTDLTVGDDKESITADPFHSRYVYAVWDRLVFDPTFTQLLGGPAWFSRTTDGGKTWEPARPIYDPGTDAQTIANQIVVLPNGTLVNVFVRFLNDFEGSPNPGDAAICVIQSYDKGAHWTQPTVVGDLQGIGVVDVKNGEPLRTGDSIPSIAVDRESGALYVTWQDARFSGQQRDGIALSKSTDGGFTWSAPIQVNRAPLVQAFIGTVDVAEDGVLGVTYYDFRNDNQDPNVLLTDYWLVVSHDGGSTWQERHVAGPFDVANAPIARGYFLGDYQSLGHRGESFLPLFVKTNSGDLDNRTDVFAAAGEESERAGNGHEERNLKPRTPAQRMKAHREGRLPH